MRCGAVEDFGYAGGAEEPGVASAGAVAVIDVLGVAADADAGERVAGACGGAVDGEAGALVRDEGEESDEYLVGPGGVDAFVGGVVGSGPVQGAEQDAAVEAGAGTVHGFDQVAFAVVPETGDE